MTSSPICNFMSINICSVIVCVLCLLWTGDAKSHSVLHYLLSVRSTHSVKKCVIVKCPTTLRHISPWVFVPAWWHISQSLADHLLYACDYVRCDRSVRNIFKTTPTHSAGTVFFICMNARAPKHTTKCNYLFNTWYCIIDVWTHIRESFREVEFGFQ